MTNEPESFSSEQLQAALADVRNSVEFTIGSEVVELLDSRTPLRNRVRRLRNVLTQLRQRRSVTQGSGSDLGSAAGASTQHVVASRPRVATVLDLFSEQAFGSELRVEPLVRGNAVVASDYDYLLVESAWAGSSGSWVRAMNRPASTAADDLARLVALFKGAERPTVFWNKEDPTGSVVFHDAMRQFDVVFSTDEGSVQQYRSMGVDAHLLELFAATRIFNPGASGRRQGSRVIFPGSLRSEKYPERAEQIDFLLGAAAECGDVTVYARPGAHESDDRWRDRLPGLEITTAAHHEMPDVYRSSSVVLNVSSVPNSPSLVPRRVYEAMACRVPVISAPCRAIATRFGDAVTVVETTTDVRDALGRFENDVVYRESVAHRAYRVVHDDHATSNRIGQIHRAIGLDGPLESRRVIAVVHATPDARDVERWLQDCLSPQLLVAERDAPAAVVEVAVTGGDTRMTNTIATWLQQRSIPARLVATHHDALSASVPSDHVAFFSTNHFYGAEYLRDLRRALEWSAEPMVGKAVGYSVSSDNDLASVLTEPVFVQRSDLLLSASLVRQAVALGGLFAGGIDDGWSNRVATGLSTSSFEFVTDACRSEGWSLTELTARCSADR